MEDRGGKRSDPRVSRHHARWAVLAGLSSLGTAVVFANDGLQREWLEGKWLHRTPAGLAWLGAFAAVSLSAFVALLVTWRRGRWVSTSDAPLRWLVPAALGGWIYGWTIEPPLVRYDAHLAIAGAAAAWSVGIVLLARRADRPWPGWIRVLDLALFEIAICAFVAEVALRVVRRATETQLLATSGTDVDTWIRSHRLEPGTSHLGFPVNVQGLVDREPAEAQLRRPLVACLGDSFSVGVVPHHLHYTSVAEDCFDGLEVYNVGVANAGPREYLRMLEAHALPMHPDLIVVAFFVGNDVTDARVQGVFEPFAAWMDRSEVLILQFPRRIWNLARERRAGAAGGGMFLEAFGIRRTERLSPTQVEERLPFLSDPLQEPPVISPQRFDYIQSSRSAITFPRNRSMYAAALSDLDRIRAAAGPVPVACLLIPDEFQVEDSQWDAVRASRSEQGADRELPQKILGAWLSERGIPFVDLLPLLRGAKPLADGKLHVYHLRDTHLNARGNRIAGLALAELIERCGIARRSEDH